MSQTETRGVAIAVQPRYVPERSNPDADEYFFAYRIRIDNNGPETVQLLSRHWIVTDGEGQSQEVRGAGVVGQQPRLDPGESFRYESACPLATPVGSMHGSFGMVTGAGEHFDALIQPFTLAFPGALN